ncbi:alpha/beta hydrolase [Bacillus salitolerans]|uniref:Alpha/beta hydrolase n=1 Tax=Bacillus salitolerans TaxID=1437434 RepID=A0ABW4LQA7_9BACI
MSLHPQVVSLLKMFEARGLPPIEKLPLSEARAAFEKSSQLLSKPEHIVPTENRMINGYEQEIGIRVYTPETETDRKLPAMVYFHGGGWVIGNINTHDSLCHSLAYLSNCIVIAVDYSLAPESKFPVAVEDAYLATKWVHDHALELGIDKQQIAVGGDSAGGNLAAVVTYLAQQRKELSVNYQLLLYPSTSFDYTESYERYGEGYHLTKSTMNWFREQYVSSVDDLLNPLAAPMLFPENETSKLPSTFILTAEYDPLCDGGEAFAQKLITAGVEVNYVCYPGMIHGFLGMTEFVDDAKKAVQEIAKNIKAHFEKQTVDQQN